MEPKRIPVEQWDKRLQYGVTDFVNYYLSNGPACAAAKDTEEGEADARRAEIFMDGYVPRQDAIRFRRRLGGAFTDWRQLFDMPGASKPMLEELAALVDRLELSKLTALTPQTTRHNQVDAYVNGPHALKMMLEELDKAERYIHLSVMLFYNDRSGNMLADALLAALARGVKVRVMVDYGITAIGYDMKLDVGNFHEISEKLKAAGGMALNTFNTSYSSVDWPEKRCELVDNGVPTHCLSLQDWVQREVINGLNVVNHRKFIVIDGVTSIIGSLNFGDQYIFDTPIDTPGNQSLDGMSLGVPSDEHQWHDGCFRIRGALARPLNHLFASQWMVLGGDVIDPEDDFYYPEMDRHFGEEECTLFACFPGNPVNLIQQFYLQLITYAEDETIIVNPYLIDQEFWNCLNSLDEEHSRHIKICNPMHVSDHPTNKAAVKSNMYEPFMKGVSYYDYSHTGRFSHWKITYDKTADCVLHGSYNMNERSAVHDFELGVLVRGKAFADKVRQLIEYDLSVSKKVEDENVFFKHPALHPSTYLNKVTKFFS